MMSNETPDQTTAKSRAVGAGRSPNYPQMNITQAIERIRKVYAQEHTHSVPDQSIAEALGYSSLNGTSKVVLSSLKKFGLLVANGDGFKVSQDAVAILELPADEPTRIVAIHKSALRPPVFKQLYEKYGTDLPSDASLRHYLVSLGFESDAANQVIRHFKETLRFMTAQAAIKEESTEPEREVEAYDRNMEPQRKSTSTANTLPEARASQTQIGVVPTASQLRFQVSSDCFAEVSFTSQITQEVIKKLVSYLNLSMDLYPARAEPPTHKTKTTQAMALAEEDDQEEDFEDDLSDEE